LADEVRTGQSECVLADQFKRLLDFIRRLDAASISYRLTSIRPDSVCVDVHVPFERWEVEFMEEGWVEIERFKSNGHIGDETELAVLFRDFSD
jgi:hypothetical protein